MYPGSKNPIASPFIWLKTLSLTNLIILTFLFSSCSDDNPVTPVKPSTALDTSNLYDWKLDTIYGYNCDFVYTADSNNVFISAYPAPLYYNGQTYTELNMQDPLFICDYPAGYDKDNVFFGGGKSGTYLGDPILKKWTNGNVVSYTITGDSGVAIRDIFVTGKEECWVSTQERYKIYHFNSGEITPYSLDSGQRGSVFCVNNSGALLAISVKFQNDSYSILRVYTFDNGSFSTVSLDSVNTMFMSPGCTRSGNDILYTGEKEIIYFNGTTWIKLCDAPVSSPFSNIGGVSRNNFISYGKPDSGPWQIFVWNGNKWTIEGGANIYHYYALGANVNVKDKNINIIYNVGAGISIHMKGILKAK